MTPYTASVLCGLMLAIGVVLIVLVALVSRSAASPGRARSRRWLVCVPVSVRSGVLALAAAAGAWWATGWPVAAAAVAGGVLGLPRVLSPPGPRRELALHDALARWTRRLADLLSAGAGGLEQALARSAHTAPGPLAGPVGRLVAQMRTRGTEPALRAFANELADPAVDAVVLALLLRTRAGGRGLAEVLTGHAHALGEETANRRGVEADRATARTTVRCLVGITLTLIAGLVTVAGDYLAPLGTPVGQLALAVAALIAAGSLVWMHRLTSTTSASRYLTSHAPEPGAQGVG